MFQAIDEVGANPLRLSIQADSPDTSHDLLQKHLHLQPGHPGAQTEVWTATSESHVWIRVSAEIECVRVYEGPLVVIGGDVPRNDLVADGNRHTC